MQGCAVGGPCLAVQVTAQDVRTLMPGKWVNDECLNLYFGLVQVRGPGTAHATATKGCGGVVACHVM
jgi:hypothetical protein